MHQPFKRIVPGAESAVLFVHGINATPRFFDEYVAALPEHVSEKLRENENIHDVMIVQL